MRALLDLAFDVHLAGDGVSILDGARDRLRELAATFLATEGNAVAPGGESMRTGKKRAAFEVMLRSSQLPTLAADERAPDCAALSPVSPA